MSKKLNILACLGFVALGAAIWMFLSDSGNDVSDLDVVSGKSGRISERPIAKSGKVRKPSVQKKDKGIPIDSREMVRAKLRAKEPKPVLLLPDAEEMELDALQKEVFAELRRALDDGSLLRVRKAIARLKADALAKARADGHSDWIRYVPCGVRMAMVESLGWFGGEAMTDLVEFIADESPDIAQTAIDQFEQAMGDVTMGDRDRSDVIKIVSKAVTDPDMADWLCMEINNMRHSVGIDTMLYLNENATDVVREKIPETMEFFTGEDNIATAQDAEDWLIENPDDPDDDEIYGPLDVSD